MSFLSVANENLPSRAMHFLFEEVNKLFIVRLIDHSFREKALSADDKKAIRLYARQTTSLPPKNLVTNGKWRFRGKTYNCTENTDEITKI